MSNYKQVYQTLWGEECGVCLSDDQDEYFINKCNCKNLVCGRYIHKCVTQTDKKKQSKDVHFVEWSST